MFSAEARAKQEREITAKNTLASCVFPQSKLDSVSELMPIIF